MAKKESDFKNMTLTLFMVTFIASAALGYIYEITKEPIATSKLAKQNNAIKQVVPEFNNEPGKESYKMGIDGDTLEFFPAKNDGQLVGTAVSTFTNKGFGGNIKIMVGFLPDGTIYNIAINAPGAKTKTSIPSPSINLNPKIEPLPRISRTLPRMVSAIAKPSPIPNPSIIEEITLFFEAKASERPNTIQLTTISGIKRPSCSNNEGK